MSLHVDVLTKNLKETLTLPFLFLFHFSLKCYDPCHRMTVILFQTSYDKWHILLPVDFFTSDLKL